MTKDQFDTQFMHAYAKLKQSTWRYVQEDHLDLVHELYCHLLERCHQFDTMNTTFFQHRMKWLALHRHKQFPSYLELPPDYPEPKQEEETPVVKAVRDEMDRWGPLNLNRAVAIMNPDLRTASFNRYQIKKALRPRLLMALQ